jgi:hypothetical protein
MPGSANFIDRQHPCWRAARRGRFSAGRRAKILLKINRAEISQQCRMLYLTAAGACGDPQGRMTAARAEVESDGQIGEPLCLLWWEVRPRMSLSLGIAVLPKGLQA